VLREDLESCIYYALVDLVKFDPEFGEGGNGESRRREWDRVGAFHRSGEDSIVDGDEGGVLIKNVLSTIVGTISRSQNSLNPNEDSRSRKKILSI